MACYVQKFGGTSVGNIERIQHVARLISETVSKGHQVVVVLSAMSGETDRLTKMAKDLTPDPHGRELDVLLSSGERVTIALMAMMLQSLGINARSFTGRQVGIVTDGAHTKARVSRVDTERVLAALEEGVVPIVAGFQGINEASDVTTLGRGGSDLTAVVPAAVSMGPAPVPSAASAVNSGTVPVIRSTISPAVVTPGTRVTVSVLASVS